MVDTREEVAQTDSRIMETGDRILEMIRVAVEKHVVTADQIVNQVQPKKKGRAVPALPSFTFPGSGITVQVRRLGPFTLDAINRKVREEKRPPEPPRTMVNYGTEEKPEFKIEENQADPAYKQALIEYEAEIQDAGGRRIIDTIIEHAVIVEIDEDEVANMRAFLLDLGVSQEEVDSISDHSIYVKHICIKTGEDLQALQAFVIGESMPTEDKVRAQEDTFRSEVPGQTDQEMPRTVVGNNSQHHS